MIKTPFICIFLCFSLGSISYAQNKPKENKVHGFLNFTLGDTLKLTDYLNDLYRIKSNGDDTSKNITTMTFLYTGTCCQSFAGFDVDNIILEYSGDGNSPMKLKRIQAEFDTLSLRGKLKGTIASLEREKINFEKNNKKLEKLYQIISNAFAQKGSIAEGTRKNPVVWWTGDKVVV